jgi:Ca-activated chloride channel family protein
VGFLLDEIRLRGESQELKDEVTELARRYGIVTPYTAYLIIEDERRRDLPATSRFLPQLEQNVQLQRELGDAYRSFAYDAKGDAAVAGARSSQALRLAQAPENAIQSVNIEAARPNVAPAAGSPSAAFTGAALAPTPAQQRRAEQLSERADTFNHQTRFVAGKSFYQNNGQWIDSLSQNISGRSARRIQFGSDEYFALAAAHPEALPWLALGTQVTFMLKDNVYTIYE